MASANNKHVLIVTAATCVLCGGQTVHPTCDNTDTVGESLLACKVIKHVLCAKEGTHRTLDFDRVKSLLIFYTEAW